MGKWLGYIGKLMEDKLFYFYFILLLVLFLQVYLGVNSPSCSSPPSGGAGTFTKENLCPPFRQIKEGQELFLYLLILIAFSSRVPLCQTGILRGGIFCCSACVVLSLESLSLTSKMKIKLFRLHLKWHNPLKPLKTIVSIQQIYQCHFYYHELSNLP